MSDDLEPSQYEEVYVWVDEIPLSRPRRNIHRDFSDGVMFAEVVQYFLPRMVELHNYIPANSVKQKRLNWELLAKKVFPRLHIPSGDVNTEFLVQAKPGAIEKLLYMVKTRLESAADQGVSDSSLVPHELTPPNSERQCSPIREDNASLGKDSDHDSNPPDNVYIPATDAAATGQNKSGDHPAPTPHSMIPVKKQGAAVLNRVAAGTEQRRTPPPPRSRITSRQAVPRASGVSAAAPPVETPPSDSSQSELVRLRQLTIEQAEEIAVLTARCQKLQKLLELREFQLQQQ